MHIILSVLSSVALILLILNRLANAGIDLAGLNPFLWRRRRAWKKQYTGNPIFKIESPLDLTALLMVGLAKMDGDLSREDKQELLSMFENEFSLSRKNAADLLVSSSYLLKDGTEFRDQTSNLIAPSLTNFSPEQAKSALAMLQKVANFSNSNNAAVTDKVAEIESCFSAAHEPPSKWN